jgi:hypothetical protein
MATPKTGRPVGRPKRPPEQLTPGRSIYLARPTFAAVAEQAATLEATLGGRWTPDRVVAWALAQAQTAAAEPAKTKPAKP